MKRMFLLLVSVVILAFVISIFISPYTSSIRSAFTGFFKLIPSGLFHYSQPKSQFYIESELTRDVNIVSMNVENSSFLVNGICTNQVKIGDLTMKFNFNQQPCNIKGYATEGDLSFYGKVLKLSLKVSSLEFMNSKITFSKKENTLYVEVIPFNFSISNAISKEAQLTNANGEIKKFVDGKIKTTEKLYGETINLYNFKGSISSDLEKISIKGYTSKVTNNFEWV